MSTIGTLNSTVYDTADFDDEQYASKFNQLICDIFEHCIDRYAVSSTTTLTVGSGSKVFNLSSNASSVSSDLQPGAWVFARPSTSTGNVPDHVGTFMLGVVTSATSTQVTINSSVYRGAGSYSNWTLSQVGDIDTTVSSPLPVAQGGTGSATLETGRDNIGAGMPDKVTGFFEDFCGYWTTANADADAMISEKWETRTRRDPLVAYESVTNPKSGGVFYPQATGLFSGSNVVTSSAEQAKSLDYWSNHPGVIGLHAPAANSRIYLGERGVSASPGNLVFPLTGDVLEISFMFPVGRGFNSANTGCMCFGAFSVDNTDGAYMCAVGGAQGLKNFLSGSSAVSSAMGVYPNQFSVVTKDFTTGTVSAWVDDNLQNSYLVIQEGVWYKVRMTKDNVKIYTSGNILAKTIDGWGFSGLNPWDNVALTIYLEAFSLERPVTLLVDYLSYTHPLTR